MKKLVEKSVKELLSRIESAETFALKHAPDVAKEIIKETYINLIPVLFVNLVLGVGFAIAYHYSDFDHYGDANLATGIIGTFLIISSFFSVFAANDTLTAILCPRLYLLRSLRNLI